MVGEGKARFIPLIFVLNSSKEEFKKVDEQVMNSDPDGVAYFSYYEGLEKIFDDK